MTYPKIRPGLVFGTGLGGLKPAANRQPKTRAFPRPDETDQTWRENAACRDQDPDLFFGPDGERNFVREAREHVATRFCKANCPVMFACRAWAVQSGQEVGVWGGLGEDERKALKRREVRIRSKSVGAS